MATTCLGAAGSRIGLGASILTTGCLGSSGAFIWGTFTISGSFGLGGTTLGLTGSTFFRIGSVRTVSFLLLSMVCVVAAPITTMTKAMTKLITSEVTVDALLCPPVSRTPK